MALIRSVPDFIDPLLILDCNIIVLYCQHAKNSPFGMYNFISLVYYLCFSIHFISFSFITCPILRVPTNFFNICTVGILTNVFWEWGREIGHVYVTILHSSYISKRSTTLICITKSQNKVLRNVSNKIIVLPVEGIPDSPYCFNTVSIDFYF